MGDMWFEQLWVCPEHLEGLIRLGGSALAPHTAHDQ